MSTLAAILKEFVMTDTDDFCDGYAPETLIINMSDGSFDNNSDLLSEAKTLRINAAKQFTFNTDGYFPENVVVSNVKTLVIPHDFHTKLRTLVLDNVSLVVFTEVPCSSDKVDGQLSKLVINNTKFLRDELVIRINNNSVDCDISINETDARHMRIYTPRNKACCIKLANAPDLGTLIISNHGHIPHLDISVCYALNSVVIDTGKVALLTIANVGNLYYLSVGGSVDTLQLLYTTISKPDLYVNTLVINEPLTPPILPWTNALRLWWCTVGCYKLKVKTKLVSDRYYYCIGYDINNYAGTVTNSQGVSALG